MKTCTKCKQDLPLEAFTKHRTGRDGLQPACRECRSAQNKAWYDGADAPTRAARNEASAAWKAAHREEVNARARARAKQVRLDAIEVMGGVCVECGSTEDLILDHINGGGSEHRRQEGNTSYYARIVREGGDPRFQVLCEDCHDPKTRREIAESNSAYPRTPAKRR